MEAAGLRRRVAGGTVVNAAFLVVVNGLALLRGFAVAGFLGTSDYGLWGAVLVMLLTIGWLRQVGLGDRYIQQDEEDQELAFQRAFTLELALASACVAAGLVLVPLVALLLDLPELLAPALVLSLALPLGALQAPLWIHARRLDFARQRRIQAADPIVATVVSVALAAAGAGVWSLVGGGLAGALAAAALALRSSPYRIRLRFDRQVAREYVEFSWPLLLGSGVAVVMGQVGVFVAKATVGVAGLGALTLANNVSQFATRADQAISEALYPAVTRVKDRPDLMLEAFLKSNRLALLWGVPFGFGVALFAPDLVDFVIGSEWEPAVVVLQATGVVAALHQIGFNWSVFYRAVGRTRPVAVAAGIAVVAFLALPLPLLAAFGLEGIAWGLVANEAVLLTMRIVLLKRLFRAFRVFAYCVRALLPLVPPVAVVLAVRALTGGDRTATQAAAELALYVVATVAATVLFERALLREVAGYLGVPFGRQTQPRSPSH